MVVAMKVGDLVMAKPEVVDLMEAVVKVVEMGLVQVVMVKVVDLLVAVERKVVDVMVVVM